MSTAVVGSGRSIESPRFYVPGYEVPRDHAEISDIVSKNIFVRPFLAEVADTVHRYFPSVERLELELDPMEPNRRIGVCVVTNAPDALACLERFDAHWWLDAIERGQWLVSVSVGRP